MGLFRPSKAELEEQIEDLRETVDSLQEEQVVEVTSLASKVKDLRSDVDALEDDLATAQRAVDPDLADDDNEVVVGDGMEKRLQEPRTAWKLVTEKQSDFGTSNKYVAKLYLPRGTMVVNPMEGGEGKCRASEAVVGGIYDRSQFARYRGSSFNSIEEARVTNWVKQSWWDNSFEYVVGQTVKPDKPFNNDVTSQCESGIHFHKSKDTV